MKISKKLVVSIEMKRIASVRTFVNEQHDLELGICCRRAKTLFIII